MLNTKHKRRHFSSRISAASSIVLTLGLASAMAPPEAPPRDNEPKANILMTNGQNADGETVVLLSEFANPIADQPSRRELYYYRLFIPRNVSSDTDFSKECGDMTSFEDEAKIGSGQGKDLVLDTYRQPDGSYVTAECINKSSYVGLVPSVEDSNDELINYEKLQRPIPDPPMQARIVGSLEAKDLTINLTGSGQAYRLRFNNQSKRWEFMDPPSSRPAVKPGTGIENQIRVTAAASSKVQMDPGAYHELIGLLAEIPQQLPKHGRHMALMFFVLPHGGGRMQQVCIFTREDDKAVGSTPPQDLGLELHATITGKYDDAYETLVLADATRQIKFVWDREASRWNPEPVTDKGSINH